MELQFTKCTGWGSVRYTLDIFPLWHWLTSLLLPVNIELWEKYTFFDPLFIEHKDRLFTRCRRVCPIKFLNGEGHAHKIKAEIKNWNKLDSLHKRKQLTGESCAGRSQDAKTGSTRWDETKNKMIFLNIQPHWLSLTRSGEHWDPARSYWITLPLFYAAGFQLTVNIILHFYHFTLSKQSVRGTLLLLHHQVTYLAPLRWNKTNILSEMMPRYRPEPLFLSLAHSVCAIRR